MTNWRIHPVHNSFAVSDTGLIKRIKTGRILKGSICNRYLTVCLCVKRKQCMVKIHTLVAEVFLGPRPQGCVIHHKDGDKLNNRYGNLEYVKLCNHNSGLGNVHARYSSDLIRNIRKDFCDGINTIDLSCKYNINRYSIVDIVRNIYFKDHNYHPPYLHNKGLVKFGEDGKNLRKIFWQVGLISQRFGRRILEVDKGEPLG